MDLNKPGALALTDWFDASKFNPGSVGVYQVNSSVMYSPRYSYWDGLGWCWCAGTISDANADHQRLPPWSEFHIRAFRGLKNKPE